MCTVNLNGHTVSMEIDTGASMTIISERQWSALQAVAPHLNLTSGNLPCLRTYAGETIQPVGRAYLQVDHNNQEYDLPALVVPGQGPNLLGRDWLSVLRINWATVHQVDKDDFLRPFQSLFAEGLGTLKGVKARFYVDENVQPAYIKARPVTLAYREKVEQELDRLQEAGVIYPVDFSEWASPIVPVWKTTGGVRICGDYSVTINHAVRVDKYPLPNISDLYAKLSGGQIYSKLDLRNAYLQVVLDDDSQKLTTINTTKGLFRYERLPYGVSSSPGIFQRLMEQLLQGIPMTAIYLDDVLVTGRTLEDHDSNLRAVLTKLQDAGLRLKKEKCSFHQFSCTYLGHTIDAEGIHPTDSKVQALQNAPEPKDESELRSLLGLLHYYHTFLPNLSTLVAPLHDLLRKGVKWNWGPRQRDVFAKAKKLLTSDSVLVHYDPAKPIVVSTDASSYGLGSVLSHRMPGGICRPVAYASRSLSAAEKNYGQIEKEALAVVFAVTKFHKYLYGREFMIQTDHRPLLGLLKQNKLIPPMSSARMQRWALTLSNYQYALEYEPGSRIGHADGLSCLPISQTPSEVPVPEEVVLALNMLDETLVTSDQIARWTLKDPVLVQVRQFVEQGWPSKTPSELAPYSTRRDELSIQQGVLMWGARVIVPPQARETLLDELHYTHPGIVRMKGLARSYLWWPGLDAEIENKVRDCTVCQEHNNRPAVAPLHPWEWPGRPWHRIHVDYAGPFEGRMILIIVDAHSKYIDAHIVSSATTGKTLTKLRQTFATLGLPTTMVTDNGTCFTSEEFEQFCRVNGIKHITSSPYHAASNGQAERAVQTVKAALKKSAGEDLENRLYRFLATYRVTPQSTTGQAPTELVLRYRPRTRLDLIRPSIRDRVLEKQRYDKERHDSRATDRVFYAGDAVWAVNFQGTPKWIHGVIEQQLGPVTFTIRLPDGRLWRRHQDHLQHGRPKEPGGTPTQMAAVPIPEAPLPTVTLPPPGTGTINNPRTSRGNIPESAKVPETPGASPSVVISVPSRVVSPQRVQRSGRQAKLPDRLDL